jgi:hypothetical protein
LPAGFVAAVNYVVSYFDSLFTNNTNLTIDVGYGEIDGQSLSSGALGKSLAYIISEPYSSVRNALLAENAPGANTLPASAPPNAPATLVMTDAEAMALGLIANSTNSNSIDGYVGFDAAPNTFSYSTTSGPPWNEYDFVGTVEHEFSEIMGRISGLDIAGAYTPMDLYRYAAANTRQFTSGAASYFSIDGGVTDLDNWNNFQTGNAGDLGDWAPNAGNDAFDDNIGPGVTDAVTGTDLALMNAIGWTSASPLQMTLSSNVFWRNSSNDTLADWTMSGSQITSGALVTSQGNVVDLSSSWSLAGVGDFNGNGTSDLLWRNTDGALAEWTMNSSQITSDPLVTFQGNPVDLDSSWSLAGVGDFTGNGTSDLLWRNANGTLAEWAMNGSQITSGQEVTFQGNAVDLDPSWSLAGVGDFNGNGTSDLLWRNSNGTLAEWTMSGSQIPSDPLVTFQGNAVDLDPSWSLVGVGDFNGNGTSDVLWRDTNGTLAEWTMNGSQITSGQAVTFQGNAVTLDASWQIAQIGDFTGNGTSDILWRNSDGALAEWTMNGSQITSGQLVTFEGNPVSIASSWTTLANLTDFIG